MRLKVDPRRGDQMVRGAAVLPHAGGRKVVVAVFAEGEAAEAARAAGADIVGGKGGGAVERPRVVCVWQLTGLWGGSE